MGERFPGGDAQENISRKTTYAKRPKGDERGDRLLPAHAPENLEVWARAKAASENRKKTAIFGLGGGGKYLQKVLGGAFKGVHTDNRHNQIRII